MERLIVWKCALLWDPVDEDRPFLCVPLREIDIYHYTVNMREEISQVDKIESKRSDDEVLADLKVESSQFEREMDLIKSLQSTHLTKEFLLDLND